MLVLFVLLVAFSVWFISPLSNFPSTDDWVYAQNVLNTLAEKKFTLSTGQYAYGIPQVLVGLFFVTPDEEPFSKLRWIGIVSGVLAAIFVACLCQKALQQKSQLMFFLGATSIFFFVPYFQPSFTFMTDSPAFLFWVVSVGTLGLFLEKSTITLWFLALVANTVAVSERQLAAFIPFSVVLSQNVGFRLSQGRKGVIEIFKKSYPVMAFVIPLVLIQLWWMEISNVKTPDSSFSPNPGVFIRLSRQIIYLGWTAIPFLCIPVSTNDSKRLRAIFKKCLIVFMAGFILHMADGMVLKKNDLLPPFVGAVLTKQGILPITLSGVPETIFSVSFRFLLLVLGFLGALRILLGFSLIWDDKERSKTADVILWSSLCYSIFICFRGTQFDRYFIPVLPLSLLCLLKTSRPGKLSQGRKVGTFLFCGVYVLFPTTLVSDYFRWNEVRKEAFQFATTIGAHPKNVCSGLEYDIRYEANHNICLYKVSFLEIVGFKVEKTFPYSSIWGSRKRYMYLLKKEGT